MHEEVNNKKNTHSVIFYCMIALIVLLLLNAFVFLPLIFNTPVTQVGYDEFLNMIEDGSVQEVAYDETEGQITFIATDDAGNARYYVTGT